MFLEILVPHCQDLEPSQGKTTGSAVNAETPTLGSKGRKTGLILKESRSNINNATTARKWLAKEELLIYGEDTTTSSLAQALMWLASGDNSTFEQLVDGIRAVALCLEGCSSSDIVDSAIIEINETAEVCVEEAKKVVHKTAEEAVEAVRKKAEEGGRKSWADQMDEHDQELGGRVGRSYTSYAQVASRTSGRNDAAIVGK
jgi:hypothetical protein